MSKLIAICNLLKSNSVLFACALACQIAQAQPFVSSEAINLRAVDGNVSSNVVQYIAMNAQPVQLPAEDIAVSSRKTLREVIESQCGSYRQEYYQSLLKMNQQATIALDEPLGDTAQHLKLPACLYVKDNSEGLAVTVAPRSSAYAVYKQQTGGNATAKQLTQFFGEPIKALRLVYPGDLLTGKHFTAPVAIVPLSGQRDAFLSGLKSELNNDKFSEVRVVNPSTGSIILPIEDQKAGTIASADAACVPAGEPFDAALTGLALKHSRERASSPDINILGGRADVVIVDNGFFGADPTANPSHPYDGSAFSPVFFKSAQKGLIARTINLDGPIWPINYSNNVALSSISGHGTHVAGLVIGGPGFAAFRSAIASDADVWEGLTILNIARGSGILVGGAEATLQSEFGSTSDHRIVNMSISYDGLTSPDIGATFRRLVTGDPSTLFVVSAGNNHRDVISAAAYPAALGGIQSPNVISVAAVDGNGMLAHFSNFSSSAVDIAAPGCGIKSWLSNKDELTALSGTSQAAPFVTFTASLLDSLMPNASPRALKERIISSGDLLSTDDQARLAYRVKLNIPKSLYLFDDYIEVRGARADTLLGDVESISGLRCLNDSEDKSLREIMAVKRDSAKAWVIARPTGNAIPAPCEVVPNDSARVVFKPKFQIRLGEITEMQSEDARTIPLSDVVDLVVRMPVED